MKCTIQTNIRSAKITKLYYFRKNKNTVKRLPSSKNIIQYVKSVLLCNIFVPLIAAKIILFVTTLLILIGVYLGDI